MVRMTIHELMEQSMMFSEFELHILNKVATCKTPLSAYDLSNHGDKETGKDYSTVHKACKGLIKKGILEFDTETNDNNVQKKVLKFTLYGFCQYVAERSIFLYRQSIDQVSILKKWKHLHESFDWVYSLVSKKAIKDDQEKTHILAGMYFSCADVIKSVHEKKYDEGIYRDRTLPEIFAFVDTELYGFMFQYIFERVVPYEVKYPGSFDDMFNMPFAEAIGVINKSGKGRAILKEYFKREVKRFELRKKVYDML